MGTQNPGFPFLTLCNDDFLVNCSNETGTCHKFTLSMGIVSWKRAAGATTLLATSSRRAPLGPPAGPHKKRLETCHGHRLSRGAARDALSSAPGRTTAASLLPLDLLHDRHCPGAPRLLRRHGGFHRGSADRRHPRVER